MALWDKLKTELDRAGRAAQTAFDEGKVRLELLRLRQLADKAAQALGYALYNARMTGGQLDEESYTRLSSTLAAHEAEIARLEAQIAAEREQAAQRPASAQATMQDEPSSGGSSHSTGGTGGTGGTGSSGTTTGSSGTESSTGPGGGTPPFSRPVSSDPRGVDPAMGDGGPSGQGGPSQPPGY